MTRINRLGKFFPRGAMVALSIPLLLGGVTGCGLVDRAKQQGITPPSTQVGVVKPVVGNNAKYMENFQLQASAKAAEDGRFTRYSLLLSGSEGITEALLKVNLPEGAIIKAVASDEAALYTEQNIIMVTSFGADTRLSVDIEGVTSDTPVTFILAEALSQAGSLKAPQQVEVVAESVQTLSALPILSFDEQFSSLLQTVSAQEPQARAQSDAKSRIVPQPIQREWLTFEAGDVDLDGSVSAKDTFALTGTLMNLRALEPAGKFTADLEADWTLNNKDLEALLKKRAHMNLGIKSVIPVVHPKSIELGKSPSLIVIGNAGSLSSNLSVRQKPEWLEVTQLSGLSEKNSVYEVKQTGEAFASGEMTFSQGEEISETVSVKPAFIKTGKIEKKMLPGETAEFGADVSISLPEGAKASTISIEDVDWDEIGHTIPTSRENIVGGIRRVRSSEVMVGRYDTPIVYIDRENYINSSRSADDGAYMLFYRTKETDMHNVDPVGTKNGWKYYTIKLEQDWFLHAHVLDNDGVEFYIAWYPYLPNNSTIKDKLSLEAMSPPKEDTEKPFLNSYGINISEEQIIRHDDNDYLIPLSLGMKEQLERSAETYLDYFYKEYQFDKNHFSEYNIILVPTSEIFDGYSLTDGYKRCNREIDGEIGRIQGYHIGSTIALCLDGDNSFKEGYLATLKHELYHGVQWSFYKSPTYSPASKWLIEGTARLSEQTNSHEPGGASLSTKNGRISIFEPLNQTGEESKENGRKHQNVYAHQDFWYFILKDKNKTFGALKPFFGNAMADHRAGMDAAFAEFGYKDRGEAYERFAEERYIKHEHPFLDKIASCQPISTPNTELIPRFSIKETPFKTEGAASALQSQAFEYTITSADSTYLYIRDIKPKDDERFSIKLYLSKNGVIECEAIEVTPEGHEIEGISTGDKLYLLVSNIEGDSPENAPFNFEITGGQLKTNLLEIISVSIKLGETDTQEFEIGNKSLARLKYEIKITPEGDAAENTKVEISGIPLSGTLPAGELKGNSVEPEMKNIKLVSSCDKPSSSTAIWNIKITDPSIAADNVLHEMQVGITCGDKPIITVEAPVAHVTTSGDSCSVTTRTEYTVPFSIEGPDYDPGKVSPGSLTGWLDGQLLGVVTGEPYLIEGESGDFVGNPHNLKGLFTINGGAEENAAYESFNVPKPKVETQDKACLPPPPPCPGCGTNGDPHLYPFDRSDYDFHGVGEFILARSRDGEFEIQTRFKQTGAGSSNAGVAMNVAGDRVGVYPLIGSSTTGDVRAGIIQINDEIIPYRLNDLDLSVNLPQGGRLSFQGMFAVVTWPDGSVAKIVQSTQGIIGFIRVHPSAALKGQLEGLLGDYDGNPANDRLGQDGQQYALNLSYEQLYKEYGQSWRVTDANSLFYYRPGESTETFTDLSFPPPPREFTPAEVAQARQTCEASRITSEELLDDCVFDVIATQGRPELVEAFVEAAEMADPSYLSVQISPASITGKSGGTVELKPHVLGEADILSGQWTAAAGELTPLNHGGVLLTIPEEQTAAIEVRYQLGGKEAIATVRVEPNGLDLNLRGQTYVNKKFQLDGRATGIYTGKEIAFEAEVGTVYQTGSKWEYQAPANAGRDSITAYLVDKPEVRVTRELVVNNPLISIGSFPELINPKQSLVFSAEILGGNGGETLNWSVSGGTIKKGLGGIYLYEAPVEPGEYVLTVSSSSLPNSTITKTFRVGVRALDFRLTPHEVRTFVGETVNFEVQHNDHSPQLTWSATGGELTPQTDKATYIASDPGLHKVTVTDRIGNLKEADVSVHKPNSIEVTGEQVSVGQEATLKVKDEQGIPYSGPLTWTTTGGTLTETSDGIARLVSNDKTGVFTVTATAKNSPKYQVSTEVVVGKLAELRLTESRVHSRLTTTIQAVDERGEPYLGDLTWTTDGGWVTKLSEGKFTFIAGEQTGQFKITAAPTGVDALAVSTNVEVVRLAEELLLINGTNPKGKKAIAGQPLDFLPLTSDGNVYTGSLLWRWRNSKSEFEDIYESGPQTIGAAELIEACIYKTNICSSTNLVTEELGIEVSPRIEELKTDFPWLKTPDAMLDDSWTASLRSPGEKVNVKLSGETDFPFTLNWEYWTAGSGESKTAEDGTLKLPGEANIELGAVPLDDDADGRRQYNYALHIFPEHNLLSDNKSWNLNILFKGIPIGFMHPTVLAIPPKQCEELRGIVMNYGDFCDSVYLMPGQEIDLSAFVHNYQSFPKLSWEFGRAGYVDGPLWRYEDIIESLPFAQLDNRSIRITAPNTPGEYFARASVPGYERILSPARLDYFHKSEPYSINVVEDGLYLSQTVKDLNAEDFHLLLHGAVIDENHSNLILNIERVGVKGEVEWDVRKGQLIRQTDTEVEFALEDGKVDATVYLKDDPSVSYKLFKNTWTWGASN